MELTDSSKCTRLITSDSIGAMLTLLIRELPAAFAEAGIVSVTMRELSEVLCSASTESPESTAWTQQASMQAAPATRAPSAVRISVRPVSTISSNIITRWPATLPTIQEYGALSAFR